MNSRQSDLTAAAVLFAHQFATLICAGVSLVRALAILEEEAPAPYGEAMRTVRTSIEGGQTLTKAIETMPEPFPPFYRVMIRAGEVGGILDITLSQAADLLEEDWTLSRMIGVKPLLMAKEEEGTLSPVRQTLQLLLFCRMWGSMLAAGVPLLSAMEVAAESLQAPHRAEVLAASEVINNHGTIEESNARMTFLPRSAKTLITIGADEGQLDTYLLKAAELYRHQLIYQRQVE